MAILKGKPPQTISSLLNSGALFQGLPKMEPFLVPSKAARNEVFIPLIQEDIQKALSVPELPTITSRSYSDIVFVDDASMTSSEVKMRSSNTMLEIDAVMKEMVDNFAKAMLGILPTIYPGKTESSSATFRSDRKAGEAQKLQRWLKAFADGRWVLHEEKRWYIRGYDCTVKNQIYFSLVSQKPESTFITVKEDEPQKDQWHHLDETKAIVEANQ